MAITEYILLKCHFKQFTGVTVKDLNATYLILAGKDLRSHHSRKKYHFDRMKVAFSGGGGGGDRKPI